MSIRPKLGARSRWTLPALLAFGLHVLVALALLRAGPLVPRARAEEERPVIDVVFAPREESAPTTFTELPADRADAPPDTPEFLSNVDSRARDETPAGDDTSPRMTGPSEVVAVEIPEGEPDATTATDAPEMPAKEPAAPGAPPAVQESPRETGTRTVTVAPPSRLGERPETASARRRGDVPQAALFDPGSNSALTGSVSLSTTAWDYAEWLQAFRRDFLPNWRPPSGWRWQLVFGRTRLAMHVGRDGSLLDLEILEQEGHKVLHDASLRAVERTAPFRALPDDFPDEELVLVLDLIYPRVRP